MRFIHRILPLLLLAAVVLSACAVPVAPAETGTAAEGAPAEETTDVAAGAEPTAPELVIAVQGLPPPSNRCVKTPTSSCASSTMSLTR